MGIVLSVSLNCDAIASLLISIICSLVATGERGRKNKSTVFENNYHIIIKKKHISSKYKLKTTTREENNDNYGFYG